MFTYNAIGNLTGKSDVGSYTYPALGANSVRPHAVTGTSNGWAFDYDANGNMTSRTVTEGTYQLSYTWENRLAAITETTSMAVTRYVYDADGALVKKTSGDQTSYYVNAGYEELRVGSFVTPTKTYSFGAQRVALTVTGTLSYLYSDHLGSASLATNATGGVTSEMRYYPYGETRWTGTGSMPTDRRFTGQREETGLELYDFVARTYDPRLGRFLQADTIVPDPGNPQSLNRYLYVYGNPAKYKDPSGHIAETEADDANAILEMLRRYGMNATTDWGWLLGIRDTVWNPGLWQLAELQAIQQAVERLVETFGGTPIPSVTLNIERVNESGIAANVGNTIRIRNDFLAAAMPQVAFVHEFAHAWDYVNGGKYSTGLPTFRGDEPGPTAYGSGTGLGTWSSNPPANEWAESVAAYVYPEYIAYLRSAGTAEYDLEKQWARELTRRPEYQRSHQRRPGLGQYHTAYVALQIDGPFWPYVR